MMEAGPFFVLTVVLGCGAALGTLTKRLGLPAITGQIVAGIALGTIGVELFSASSVQALRPITDFALGLMAVSVGAHLDLRRLRPMRWRLLLLLVAEVVLVTGAVAAAVVSLGDLGLGYGILLGAIGVSTAPATVVALVKETRAKGMLVNTLLAGVGLNNLACIFLFEVCRSVLRAEVASGGSFDPGMVQGAAISLGEAALAGGLAAASVLAATRWVKSAGLITTAGVIAIVGCVGLARELGFSSMLACLFLGITQTNLTHRRDEVVDRFFHGLEPAILAAFFTLAGMELTLEHAAAAGVAAALFVAARMVAKLAAGSLAMRLAGAAARIRDRVGLAMIPQAGVAVGLVVLLEEDATLLGAGRETIEMLVAIVLTGVVVNEVVGPILTRLALVGSGEAGQDHERLMDFIREEHVVVGLEAATMEEAIEELVQRLGGAQRLPRGVRDALLAALLEREAEESSCLGSGLAVPHAELEEAEAMMGVFAVSQSGLDVDTPDGEPVHVVLLLGFPKEERARHLRILALLGRTIGHDAQVRHALANARTADSVCEVLLEAGFFEPRLEEGAALPAR